MTYTFGWLGHSEAVPQSVALWGTASLCPSHPAAVLYKTCDEILGTLVGMINHPNTWVIK